MSDKKEYPNPRSLKNRENYADWENVLCGQSIPKNHEILIGLNNRTKQAILKVVNNQELYKDSFFSLIRYIPYNNKQYGILVHHGNEFALIFEEIKQSEYIMLYQIYGNKPTVIDLGFLDPTISCALIGYFNYLNDIAVPANYEIFITNTKHTIHLLRFNGITDLPLEPFYQNAVQNMEPKYWDFVNNALLDVGSYYSMFIYDSSIKNNHKYNELVFTTLNKTNKFNWKIPMQGISRYLVAEDEQKEFLVFTNSVIGSKDPEVIKLINNVLFSKRFLCFWSGECGYMDRKDIPEIFVSTILCPILHRYSGNPANIHSPRQRMLLSCKYNVSGLVHRPAKPSNCVEFRMFKNNVRLPGKYYAGIGIQEGNEICLPYSTIFEGEPLEPRKIKEEPGYFGIIYTVPPGTEDQYKYLIKNLEETSGKYLVQVLPRKESSNLNKMLGSTVCMMIAYYR
jgi:hypothetical protein